MSTTGKGKWEKYFRDREVETYIKANSKATESKNTTESGVVLEHGTPITAFGGNTYSTFLTIAWKGNTSKIHIDTIEKPGTRGSQVRMNIEATKLIGGGKDETIPLLMGQKDVKSKCFYSADEISKSILEGLEAEPSVPDFVVTQMEDYFNDNNQRNYKFLWSKSIDDSLKKQIGVYVGELLVGYMMFKGQTGHVSQNIINKQNVKCFVVPDDPQFAGADSAVLDKDGTVHPISSKFGKGAAASFWANLAPVALKHYNAAPKEMQKLLDSVTAVGGPPERSGKKIVWHYGIREIMNIPKSQISEPYDVFSALKKKDLSKYGYIVEMAKEYVNAGGDGKESSAKVLINNITNGQSLTAIWCRGIADRIMNNKESFQFIKEIIAGKNFYQANLDDGKFLRGDVFFKVNLVSKGKIEVTGSKAATNNLDASQGTVNYSIIF